MALISAAATAVFWVTEGFEAAWPFALVMTAFIAVVHFGRQRSNVLEVMSGTGDERIRSLYTRSVAFPAPSWRGSCQAGGSSRSLREIPTRP